MGILESDLPNLPYKLVKWQCMVDGCKNACRVRDYGIAPHYYWPVRVFRAEDGSWYGGWITALHGYICSTHWKEVNKGRVAFFRKHACTEQFLLSRITPITKSKLYKR